MTVAKPTLLAFSPGRATGYTVTAADYNNDTLQQGAWTQLMLGAQTSFPASPAAGDTCFRSDLNAWYQCTNATGPVWNQLSVGAFTTAARPAAPPTNYRYIDLTDGVTKRYNGTAYDGAWLTVGGTGVAFSGTWVNFGGGFMVARYRKRADGDIEIEGMISTGAANSSPFTLPAGYQPATHRRFIALDATNVDCFIDISTAGVVTVFTANVNGVVFSHIFSPL